MVDLEEEFHPEELTKLAHDVQEGGLGLLVFADWYNAEAMGKMGFYDDNTRSWWTPATGRRHHSCVPVLRLYIQSMRLYAPAPCTGTCSMLYPYCFMSHRWCQHPRAERRAGPLWRGIWRHHSRGADARGP